MANMKLALLLVALAVPAAVYCKPVETSDATPTLAGSTKQEATASSKIEVTADSGTTVASQSQQSSTESGSTFHPVANAVAAGSTSGSTAGPTEKAAETTKETAEMNQGANQGSVESVKTTKSQEASVAVTTTPVIPKVSSTESPNETTKGVLIEASTTAKA